MSTSIETPLETKMQVRACLAATYRRRGSWEAVADYYGKFSKAAYWRTAKEPGYLPPPGLMENVLAKGAAPRLQSIPIYPDADVDVYYRSGNGSLHTYTVPADAEVVIVPAGARVVQSKPPQPKRKRTRIDITGLPLNAQEARAVLLWWLEPYRRDWPDWLRRPLAEQAATGPGEVAEGLAGLE